MIKFYINIQKKSKLLKIDQKHLYDHFDENLDSVYAQNLIEKLGPHNAEDMVSDFHLGLYKAAPIFWDIDTAGTIRHGKIQWYNSNRKPDKSLFGVKMYKSLKAAKISTKLYEGSSGYYRADGGTTILMGDIFIYFRSTEDE